MAPPTSFVEAYEFRQETVSLIPGALPAFLRFEFLNKKENRELCTSEQTCAAMKSKITVSQKDCFVGQPIPGA